MALNPQAINARLAAVQQKLRDALPADAAPDANPDRQAVVDAQDLLQELQDDLTVVAQLAS